MDKLFAGLIYFLAVDNELVVPYIDQGVVPETVVPHLLEEMVALFKGLGVGDKMVEVLRVGLRNDTVDKLTTEVATSGDKALVVGGDHHQRNFPYVLSQRLVGFLVPLHLLAGTPFEDAAGHIFSVVAMDGEEILSNFDVLTVDRIEIAFAEREVIDSVEEVGLAGAIVADEAVDVVAKRKVYLAVVLEVIQCKSVEHHRDYLVFSILLPLLP